MATMTSDAQEAAAEADRAGAGVAATVFMPEGAPIPKEKATRGYGADVVFHGRYLEDSLAAAREFAEQTGAVLIHPFDHVDIVAGQGTLGLEVLEQSPDVRTVLVPTGGGGLLAGVAMAFALPFLSPVNQIGAAALGATAVAVVARRLESSHSDRPQGDGAT